MFSSKMNTNKKQMSKIFDEDENNILNPDLLLKHTEFNKIDENNKFYNNNFKKLHTAVLSNNPR